MMNKGRLVPDYGLVWHAVVPRTRLRFIMLLLKFFIVLVLNISVESLEFNDAFNVNLRIFGGIG